MDSSALTDFNFDVSEEKCRTETNKSFRVLNDALVTKNDTSILKLFNKANMIEKRLEELLDETNSLLSSAQVQVNSLPDCSNGLQQLHEQIQNNESAAERLSIPSKLHVCMKQFDVISASDDIGALTSLICEMETYVDKLEFLDDSLMEKLLIPAIIQSAKYDFVTKKELTITNVTEKWASSVRWSFAEDGETKFAILSIDDSTTVKVVLECLHRLRCLHGKLKVLVGNILEFFVQPIVAGKKCTISISAHEISVKTHSESFADVLTVELIFENLETLFKGIATLFSADLKPVDDVDAQFIVGLIDLELAEPLMNVIVEKLIKPTITPSASDLRKYDERMKLCKQLQTSLTSKGFQCFGQLNIDNCIGDIENLITSSKCCNALEEARELIKTPLHETKLIEQSVVDCKRLGFAKIDEIETILRTELRLSDETNLPDLLAFPSCHISFAILKLVELIESLLNSASTMSNFEESSKLLETCRYVFELFLAIGNFHHAESLKQLPRNAAVFFNNCMFLSHRAATLGLEYNPKVVIGQRSARVSFIDFVPLLRNLGKFVLRDQLNEQIAVLDEYLKSCQGFVGLTMNTQAFDKGLKQCILHLKRMFTIWNEVLPIGMKYRLLAVLTNHALESCSRMALKLEDIPESDANILHTAFENLLRETMRLFQNVGEEKSSVQQYCQPHYQRLEELQRLLKGNLQTIDDRYASGHGPLAIYFDPEDVKHLIRALFQNTERRAAVLSRIHRAN